jgi:hypothetical protein
MREWLIPMIGVEWKGNGRHGFSAGGKLGYRGGGVLTECTEG